MAIATMVVTSVIAVIVTVFMATIGVVVVPTLLVMRVFAAAMMWAGQVAGGQSGAQGKYQAKSQQDTHVVVIPESKVCPHGGCWQLAESCLRTWCCRRRFTRVEGAYRLAVIMLTPNAHKGTDG
ncbi:hypothetical protein [Oleiagrimonas sp. C23AA]|uniref:hypothetical protein n=1 Tax=Oleiagrimonas sp. C23AA TaxID=2719047 RepID=UPI00141F149C|nr:hypothetical protein [Oleiagrimonas sp. C23AA]